MTYMQQRRLNTVYVFHWKHRRFYGYNERLIVLVCLMCLVFNIDHTYVSCSQYQKVAIHKHTRKIRLHISEMKIVGLG